MKITIEIDQKTTNNEIEKLIKALCLCSSSTAQKESHETTKRRVARITKDQVKDISLSRLYFEPISKVYSEIDIPYTKGWLYHQIYDNKISYQNKMIDGKKISCINKVEVEEYLKNHLEKKTHK